ncbi:MAG: von Willebrand factor type A domain protein [Candidatus Omnitrophica bacterium ADurb.Bin205]|jgi:Ca-activated chloride channel family protein|nr:MAG: von Willebrand factor type A domain protein [Candidatus Omnitrophica bacterium ADurb.Bin205]
MIIQNPIFLLLIPVAAGIIYYALRKNKTPGIRFSSERFLTICSSTFKTLCSRYIWVLRLLVFVFLALALVRFRVPIEESKIQTEGIDIILALDTSTSMLAEDFTLHGKRSNRLDVVKDVVENFIQGRKNDRIGIVAFAARAYTTSPLTLDYGWLLENLKRVRIGMIEDGTAIGSGLSVALKRLENTKAKSKIVILLTDGINNAGKISPSLAAEAAKALKVKVYTIGAGTKGMAPYPMKDFFGNTVYQPVKIDIDEDSLINIASKTEGKYFRATDTKSLKEIYAEIDRMEKSPIEEKGYMEYRELFPIFLSIAMVFLLLEVLLRNTILRRIP